MRFPHPLAGEGNHEVVEGERVALVATSPQSSLRSAPFDPAFAKATARPLPPRAGEESRSLHPTHRHPDEDQGPVRMVQCVFFGMNSSDSSVAVPDKLGPDLHQDDGFEGSGWTIPHHSANPPAPQHWPPISNSACMRARALLFRPSTH